MKTLEEKRRIVKQHIENSGIPIPVVRLAKKLGIQVYKTTLPENISGKIEKDEEKGGDSGFAIFVNREHTDNRRRFTIAHEVAHYVLHEEEIGGGIFDDALYRSGFQGNEESEANALAADILMPWNHLRKYRGEFSTPELADMFEVSEHAMSIRLRWIPYYEDE